MTPGEAFVQAIGGRVVWEPATLTQAIASEVQQGGGVSGAARRLGVPRRTLRRWVAGESKPSPARERQIMRRSIANRRQAADPTAAARIRAGQAKLRLTGATTKFNTPRKGKRVAGGQETRRNRTLDLGQHIPPDQLAQLVDAWNAGARVGEIDEALGVLIDAHYAPDMQVSFVTRAELRAR